MNLSVDSDPQDVITCLIIFVCKQGDQLIYAALSI